MIFGNPVRGLIRPDARYYPTAPGAKARTGHEPLISQDFGPSSVDVEPTVIWPGGESNIYGQPIPAGTYANFHQAIDIANAGCGYDVLAAAAGTVTTSSRNNVGTEVIVIDHGGGFATRYAHMSRRLVAVGDRVAIGQLIGKTGDTGLASSGCHLHFAVTKNGKPVDPWRRLSQNTTTDPDQEADVPTPSSYIPGQVAEVGNASGNVNVRSAAKLGASLVRTIPKGQVETWVVTCWEKGDSTAGSDQWLVRWNGGWEYVHKINVVSGPSMPPAAPDPDAIAAARAKGIADAAAAASAVK